MHVSFATRVIAVCYLVFLFVLAGALTTKDVHGPDGEGLIQLAFLWLFRTFGTAARDIRKFVRDVNALYLRRFYVSPRWLAAWLEKRPNWNHPSKIFLHHILRSDDDRDPHTHPWRFVSVILWGSYRERILWYWRRREGSAWEPVYRERVARIGSILRNTATHTHRVEIIKPVWSLVFAWPARRVWGFWTQKNDEARTPVHVPWRTYLGIPTERDSAEDVILNVSNEGGGPYFIEVDKNGVAVGTMMSLPEPREPFAGNEEITKVDPVASARARVATHEAARRIASAVERKGE